MATQKNKVLFGFSDLYIGTYEVADDGTVTLGTPYHQKGAVGYSPEDNGEKSVFHADNVEYWTKYSTGTFEGDLVVAMFDDDFKTQFLNYKKLDDGGIALIKNAPTPNVYMMFEVQGDVEPLRAIYYNGSLGPITREFGTIEDSPEPQTESIPTTFVGDAETGISRVTYNPDDAGYSTLFTNPPVPILPAESE